MKGYGFVAFSKNISKTLIKNLSENISQKVFDHVKKSTADPIKTTSKKEIYETAEATGDLIGNNIENIITKNLTHNYSGTFFQNEEKPIELLKERYVSSGKRRQIIDELILT